MYNKKEFTKLNDRKILHKIGKHWVAISLSMLTAIGGLAFTNGAVHADRVPETAHSLPSASQSKTSVGSASNRAQLQPAAGLQASSFGASSQASSASTAINQQADQLHNQIIRDAFRHSGVARSAAQTTRTRQSRSGHAASSAVQPAHFSLGKGNGNQVDNRITVTFTNQNGTQVGRKVIASHPVGSHIDVVKSDEGGASLPAGYLLDSSQDTNLVFTHSQQVAPLRVHGITVNGSVDIRITKNNDDGKSTTSDKSYPVQGQAGNGTTIQPNQFVPSGYYIDPVDHDNKIYFNPDGTISPSDINLTYDQDGAHKVDMNTIRVHYQDINNPGPDINGMPVADYTGRKFQLKTYETNVPIGYGFANKVIYRDANGSNKPVTTFENAADGIPDVYIMVRKAVTSTLHYEDYYTQKPLGHDRPIAGFDGSPIDFHSQRFQQAITPKNFIFKGYGQYDPYLHNGETDVVYLIKPGEKKPSDSHGPNDHQSQITIKFVANGELIGNRPSDIITTPKELSGTPFHPSDYYSQAPRGYQVTGEDPSTPVTKFTDHDQTVDLDVTKVKGPSDVSVTLEYRNRADGNRLLSSDTRQLSGVAGQNINFRAYIPHGFTFDGQSGTPVFKSGAVDTIYLKPISNPATIQIKYEDESQNDRVLKTVSDTGQAGTQVDNYGQYEDNSYIQSILGKGYTYDKLVNPVAKFQNNQQSVILLKKTPDHSAQGTISVQYVNSDQQPVGSPHTVTSDVGHKFDLNAYEAETMPSGYHVVKILHGNAPETFTPGTDNLTVQIAKRPNSDQKGTINVQYVNSDHQPVGNSHTITRKVGDKFDLQAYENETLPDDYRVVRIVSGDDLEAFAPGTDNLVIQVAKTSNSDKAPRGTINVQYVNSDQQSVGNLHTITRKVNTPFDLSAYENATLPDNYHVVKVLQGNVPQAFAKGIDNLKIEVAPDKAPRGTISVQYVNSDRQPVGSPHTITGDVGNAFDLNAYEAETLPGNYHAVKILSGNEPKAFAPGTDNLTVQIAKNPNSDKALGTISVQYVNSDQQPVGGPHTITGDVGNAFDLNAYEAETLPSNYHAVKILSGNDPETFAPGTDNLTVQIAKNPNSDKALGTISVQYVNSDQQPVGSPHTITGDVGNAFDLNAYEAETLPSNYHAVKILSGNDPKTFASGTDNLTVQIAKNSSNNNSDNSPQVSATIVFRNLSNDGNVMFSVDDSAPAGTAVDYNYYLTYIPQGYHFVSYGHHDSTVENGDTDVVYIAANGDNHPNHPNNPNQPAHNGGNNNHQPNNVPNQPQPSDHNGGNGGNGSNPNANSNNGNNPTPQPSDSNNGNKVPNQPQPSDHNGGNGSNPNTNSNNGNHPTPQSSNGNNGNNGQNSNSGQNPNNSGSNSKPNNGGNQQPKQPNQNNSGRNSDVSPSDSGSDGDNHENSAGQETNGLRGSNQNTTAGNQAGSHQSSSKLPQTGDGNQSASVVKLMAALSISAFALDALIDRKRRHDE